VQVENYAGAFPDYPEGSTIFTQLGVIGNLNAALEH
jgi:hypothetical protein